MRPTTTLFTAIVLASATSPALAQDKGWFTDSAHGKGLYNIQFPGGTAAEYYNELGLESEGELNVIVQDGVDLVMLPRISVRSVTGMDVVELPQKLSAGLYIDGSSNLAAAFGGPVDEVGAYTIVVKVDPSILERFHEGALQDSGERRFDLHFGGGTVLTYIEAIRDAYPGANILAMPGVERFEVPPVALRGVTVDAALESIEGQTAMIDGNWSKVRLSDADIEDRDERVFTISLEMQDRVAETRIWSVSDHIALGATEADILSAVQAALTISENDATVRFHPQTQVLIVRGSDEALGTVKATLEQVQRSARSMQGQQSVDSFWQARQQLEERISALEQQLSGKPSQ